MRYTLEMFSMSVKKRSASLRSDTSTIHRCSQFFDHQVALADGSSQSKPSNHEPNDEWSRSPLSNALRPLMKAVDDRILPCFWCLFNSNNHWFQQHRYSPMLCYVMLCYVMLCPITILQQLLSCISWIYKYIQRRLQVRVVCTTDFFSFYPALEILMKLVWHTMTPSKTGEKTSHTRHSLKLW